MIPASEVGKARPRSILVAVREFDTAEHAAESFAPVSDGHEARIANLFQGGGALSIVSKNVPGVGSQAVLVRAEYVDANGGMWLEHLTVQRDQYLFSFEVTVSALSSMPNSDPGDTSMPTIDIATAVAVDGAPSSDAVSFKEDGTSSGGLWGFMPSSDDPLLLGLVPDIDLVLYPEPVR